MSVPPRPDPPVVGKVLYNSIELYWQAPANIEQGKGDSRLRYRIQEEETGQRSKGFGNVYSGYATSNVFQGLNARTQYRYRLQCLNNSGASTWSPIITVSTTQKPKSSEDLQRAVFKGDVEAVQRILPELRWQAVNSPNKFGLSPLMIAAQSGYLEVARVLVENGADVHHQNNSGKTAMMMACFSGHLEVATLLRECGVKWEAVDKTVSTALHWAVDGTNLDVIRWMLQDGNSVDTKDSTSGWTPLMRVAATSGNLNIAKVLLHHGANIHSLDREKNSVLMNAALNGHEPLVKLLVKRGASVAVKSGHGKTALDFARSFEHESIVHFLQEQVDKLKKAENEKRVAAARRESHDRQMSRDSVAIAAVAKEMNGVAAAASEAGRQRDGVVA